jgi:hypothetical protein
MSTYVDPVPGYADSMLGLLGGTIGISTGIVRVAPANPNVTLDYVAADITVNSILAIGMTRAANNVKDCNIFNIVNNGEKFDGRE